MSKQQRFTPEQTSILQMIQDTLPDSPRPYAIIAEKAGSTEKDVLAFIEGLKKDGYIRRFGATLRHQEAGYGSNVMVAWLVQAEKGKKKIIEIIRERPEVTHCYQRKSSPKWPYNLYTMVHGKSREHCRQIVKEISKLSGIDQYEMLFSQKELKKTSMQYF